jgi:metallophosphoesterase superfamily enzyme
VWIEMTDLLIKVNGESVLLDACGAAFSPAYSVLMFADLHLEKGSAYARGRQFLPPYDSADTLRRMAQAIARHKPVRVIALGDSFHDRDAGNRLGTQDRDFLEGLARAAHFTWIGGPGTALGRSIVAARTFGGTAGRRSCRSSASLRQRGEMGPQRASPLFRV